MFSTRGMIVLFVFALGALSAAFAPLSGLVVLTDGLLSAAVLLGAIGWGAWPAVWLGHARRPLAQQATLAAGLGLGVVSSIVLALGVAGMLTSAIAWGLIAIGGACGLSRVYFACRAPRATEVASAGGVARDAHHPGKRAGSWEVGFPLAALILLLVPASVAFFAATLPPGAVWNEEARGYDALEYHLQTPREYFQSGRISFLPHNVYASFPQQMEVLYLLLMHMAGGPYEAAIAAQLLHAMLGALAVVVLAAWAPEGVGAWVAALAFGSVPWIAYLGALAYVECGLLLYAALAGTMAIECVRFEKPAGWRLAATVGLCAGLAGGCKYTALVLIVVAVGVSAVIAMRGTAVGRLRFAWAYGAAAAIAFSPWLVRNTVFAGNPIYPFASEWFDGRDWTAEQAEQWRRGHHLSESQSSLPQRLRIAGRELFGRFDRDTNQWRASLFGGGTIALGLAGLCAAGSRVGWFCSIWTATMLVAWLGLTHMPGRFVAPLVIPLAAALGQAAQRRRLRAATCVLVLISATFAAVQLVQLLREHARWWSRRGVALTALAGATRDFVEAHPLNAVLPGDAYAWLIGDAAVFYIDRRIHYTVVFSRDPWIEFAAGGDSHEAPSAAACLNWLRERGVTHVVFHWPEIERLRRTYGFAARVTHAWVQELEAAGLRRVDSYEGSTGVVVYALPGVDVSAD